MHNSLKLVTMLLLASITSCTSPEKPVVEFVKTQMKDPKSFELIKVSISDTIYKSDVDHVKLTSLMDDWKLALSTKEFAEVSLENTRLMCKYYKENCDKISKETDFLNQSIFKHDSLYSAMTEMNKKIEGYKNTSQDVVVGYTWYVSCYGNNGLGMRGIGEFFVDTYNDGSIKLNKTKF
jgi:hypothetical protein